MDTVSEAAVYLRFGLTKAHQGAIEEKDTYVQQMKQRGVFDGPALYNKSPNNSLAIASTWLHAGLGSPAGSVWR